MDETMPRRRWWPCGVAVVVLLAGASVRHERRDYRDGTGKVTATRSAVLLPWQRLPSVPLDRAGSYTSRASLAFGLISHESRQSVTVTRVGHGPPG